MRMMSALLDYTFSWVNVVWYVFIDNTCIMRIFRQEARLPKQIENWRSTVMFDSWNYMWYYIAK